MTRVILIGAGKAGKALIELFHGDSAVEIVGVADIDEHAPGLVLAKDLGLSVSTRYQELLADKTADLIIDVTGNLDVGRAIRAEIGSDPGYWWSRGSLYLGVHRGRESNQGA